MIQAGNGKMIAYPCNFNLLLYQGAANSRDDDSPQVDFGRNRKLTMPQVTELRQRRMHGALIKTLMDDYGLSKASVYCYLSDITPLSRQRTPKPS
jgi:hypothetical protein